MKTVTVRASSGEYAAVYGEKLAIGSLARAAFLPQGSKELPRAVLVSDETVFALHGRRVAESLQAAGFSVICRQVPAGERSKTLEEAGRLLDFLANEKLTRSDVLFALGGGVVGDLTGFAASVFLRGVRFVQLPTTVLAAVDSAIGGKTAVDLPAGKNLVGTFHQPAAVFCDTAFFKSLSGRDVAGGFAEIIKYGVISDAALFASLEKGAADIADICARCAAIKARFIEEDEFDTGSRRALNFGHTAGHAIETLSSYAFSHGEAVAAGMAIIARAAERLGLTAEPVSGRLEALLKQYNLPLSCEYGAPELAQKALSDKKREGGVITLVLPEKIGTYKLHQIAVDDLAGFFDRGLD